MSDRIILSTHAAEACGNDQPGGRACCIHNPSRHALTDRPLHWRADRGLMERLCVHGVGHPDPDDIAYKVSRDEGAGWQAVHGCDGCCKAPRSED